MIRHAYAYEQRRQAVGDPDSALMSIGERIAAGEPIIVGQELATEKQQAQLRISALEAALTEKLLAPPPEISPLEAALYYLQEGIGDRAKHCGYAGCRNPYFVAEKRWQKYCSEACASPSNREAKRKWWHENKGKGLL
jgi:hypothetical protein